MAQPASIRQMSRQVSRGSASEYQVVRIILDTLTLKIHWDSKCSKKFIVYFQNHVPTSVHDCYIPVAVGMGRSDLGSQVADTGSRLLRMALLAFYSFIPNSISVRIRN